MTLRRRQLPALNDRVYIQCIGNTCCYSLLAHLSRRQASVVRPSSVRRPLSVVNIFKRLLIWNQFLPYSTYSIYRHVEQKIVLFFSCSSQIRALVAMATYSLHWLMMGKVEISIYSCLKLQIFWYFFLYRHVPWVVLYEPYEFCPNRWIWLVSMATLRVNFRKSIKKSSPQKPYGG